MNGLANGNRHDDGSEEPLYSAIQRQNKTAPKNPYIAKVYIPDYEEDESKKRVRNRDRDRPIVTPVEQNSTNPSQSETLAQAELTIPSLSPEQIRVIQTLRFPPGYDVQRAPGESDLQIEAPRLFGFGDSNNSRSTRMSNGKLSKRAMKMHDSYYAQMRLHNSQRVIQSSSERNAPEFGDSAEGEVGFHKKKKASGESQPTSPLYTPAKRGTITSLPVTPTFLADGGQPMFSNARLFHPQYTNTNRNSLANSESLRINLPVSISRQPNQLASASNSSWNGTQQPGDNVDATFANASSPGTGRDLRSYAYANTKMYDNSNTANGMPVNADYTRNPNYTSSTISTNNY